MNKKVILSLSLGLLVGIIPTNSIKAQEPIDDIKVIIENEFSRQICIDVITFPDHNFRRIVKKAYGHLIGMDENELFSKLNESILDRTRVNKLDLARINSLSMGSGYRKNLVTADDFYH